MSVCQLVFKENSFEHSEQFFNFWLSILKGLKKLTIVNSCLEENESFSGYEKCIKRFLEEQDGTVVKVEHLKGVVIYKSSPLVLVNSLLHITYVAANT